MDAFSLLNKYFSANRVALDIVFKHSRMVADKALRIAENLQGIELDFRFIEDAALLHDIGVSRTFAPKIGCHGDAPYMHHGILGREILEAEGLHAHGLVCERHIGVGLTVEDIVLQQLDIPARDMIPITAEERIICFADLFYSKRPGFLDREKTAEQIRNNLSRHGMHKVEIFEKWLFEFNC